MKILIYGSGAVGSTYGWLLSQAGHDITVLVRKDQKRSVQEKGIHVSCTDFRGKQKQITNTVFCPKVVDELSANNDYEYIIVTVNNSELKHVLPVLSQSAGNAHIFFFQNHWDDFERINRYLSFKQYFFGFPLILGGNSDGENIQSVISGQRYAGTILGEITGEVTPRIQKMADALNAINLRPLITKNILGWLVSNYVIIAAILAGVDKAGGSVSAFLDDKPLLKDTIKAIREGFDVCLEREVNPNINRTNIFYYLPLFISVPISRKIFSNEALSFMIEGHLKNSREETQKMIKDVLDEGDEYRIAMPNTRSLWQKIDESIQREIALHRLEMLERA